MSFVKKITDLMAEKKVGLSIISIIVGALFTAIAVFGGDPPREMTPGFFLPVVEGVGNWYLWMWMVGPIMLLMGVWYIYDSRNKRKEFEEFMKITSRAKFTSNLREIETLSWHMKKKDRIRVAEKKAELKVK